MGIGFKGCQENARIQSQVLILGCT